MLYRELLLLDGWILRRFYLDDELLGDDAGILQRDFLWLSEAVWRDAEVQNLFRLYFFKLVRHIVDVRDELNGRRDSNSFHLQKEWLLSTNDLEPRKICVLAQKQRRHH